MRKVSEYSKRRIIELWFNGVPRDKIAQQVGVSGSTVSGIVGALPEMLKNLRELSVELDKFRLSVSEAEEGATLCHDLSELGVVPGQVGDFIQAVSKMSANSEYKPVELVQSAMKLSNLEKTSSRSYSEAIHDFENRAKNIEEQKKRMRKLRQDIHDLKNEREACLKDHQVTSEEVDYIVNLREELRTHGVTLEEAEKLQKYLENMRETGGRPEKFVEYTKKQGSLKQKTASLKRKAKQTAINLGNLHERQKTAETVIACSLSKISELNKQEDEIERKLLRLKGETYEADRRNQQAMKELGVLLQVRAETEAIAQAIACKKARLDEMDAALIEKQQTIQTLRQQTQDLKSQNKELENKIRHKLKIDDDITQLQTAIANEKRLKKSLEKENREKRARLALQDTITNFLTKRAPYDFDLLYSYVEMLKKMRQKGMSHSNLKSAVMEEQIRSQALKAFEGDLVSTAQHAILKEENRRLKEALSDFKATGEKRKEELESLSRTIEFLEALRMNFEGRSVTLTELKHWVINVFREEIEKRADERFSAVAAGTSGLFDFLSEKLNNRS